MTVTSTVGANGRNYSTLAAWAASLPATLTDAYVAQLYNDAEFLNDILILSGHTTSATNTITVTAAPGQSFADTPANPLGYSRANGVGLRTTGYYSSNSAIIIADQNVTISRLQVQVDGGSDVRPLLAQGNFSGLLLPGNVFVGGTGSDAVLLNGNASQGAVANNLIINRSGTNGLYILTNNVSVDNNTIVRYSDAGAAGIGIAFVYSGPATLRNNAVFGFSTAFSVRSGNVGATNANNLTDQASPPASFSQVGYSGSFVATASSAPNFRLLAGSALINAGTPSSVSADIFGTARPQGAAYDVGAHEMSAGSTSGSGSSGAATAYFFRGAQA